MEDRRANMANYMGNDIGQRILSSQDDINDRISQMGERLATIEARLDGFEIPSLWGKVRSHDKVLYMGWGAGIVVGWFAKVLIGK